MYCKTYVQLANRQSASPNQDRPRGYKTFFMLNSVEHEMYPARVGNLTFISRNRTSPESLRTRNTYIFSVLVFISS